MRDPWWSNYEAQKKHVAALTHEEMNGGAVILEAIESIGRCSYLKYAFCLVKNSLSVSVCVCICQDFLEVEYIVLVWDHRVIAVWMSCDGVCVCVCVCVCVHPSLLFL